MKVSKISVRQLQQHCCLKYEECNMKDTKIPPIKKPREEFQEEVEKSFNFQTTATSQKLMGEM